MSSSTMQLYALDGVHYVWDSVTGILFTSGALTFFAALLIIMGVIGLVLTLFNRVFKR